MSFIKYNLNHFLLDGNFTLQYILNNIFLSTNSPLPKRTSQIVIKRLYNVTSMVFFLKIQTHIPNYSITLFSYIHI